MFGSFGSLGLGRFQSAWSLALVPVGGSSKVKRLQAPVEQALLCWPFKGGAYTFIVS